MERKGARVINFYYRGRESVRGKINKKNYVKLKCRRHHNNTSLKITTLSSEFSIGMGNTFLFLKNVKKMFHFAMEVKL